MAMVAQEQSPFLRRPASEWVASNDLAFAIRDKYPVTPNHTLVVPKRVVALWFDATWDERVALLELVDEVRRLLDAGQPRPDGYNIGMNVGEAAGQTIMHLHIHVIPRYHGDVPVLGEWTDLRQFLFGIERGVLGPFRRVLLQDQDGPCFYCDERIRGEAVVDHFVPWARYPQDLGHNFVAADVACNGDKGDRLPAFPHLRRWSERNARPGLTAEFTRMALPHDVVVTQRVALWAYSQADRVGANVWQRRQDVVTHLDARWKEYCTFG
jgi:diadenosine tetraphosphate (Ap4A) HIT family hydrolase